MGPADAQGFIPHIMATELLWKVTEQLWPAIRKARGWHTRDLAIVPRTTEPLVDPISQAPSGSLHLCGVRGGKTEASQ